MFHNFELLYWSTILCSSVVLGQNAAVVTPIRTFILSSTSSSDLPSNSSTSGSSSQPLNTASTSSSTYHLSSSTITDKVTVSNGISWSPLNPPPTSESVPLSTQVLIPVPSIDPTWPETSPSPTSISNSTTWSNTTIPPATQSPTCAEVNKVGSCLPTTYPPKPTCTNYDADGICWPDPEPTEVPTCTLYDEEGNVTDKAGVCPPTITPTATTECSIYDLDGQCYVEPTRDPTWTCIIYDKEGNVVDKAGECSTSFLTATKTESSTQCDITLTPGQPSTVWIIKPNPTTITLTLTGNATVTPSAYPLIPEITPPTYCNASRTTIAFFPPPPTATSSTAGFGITIPLLIPAPTTIIITSKNPVTVWTTEPEVTYPGGAHTGKVTVTTGISWVPLDPPPPNTRSGEVDTTIPGVIQPTDVGDGGNVQNPGNGGNSGGGNSGGGGSGAIPVQNPASNSPAPTTSRTTVAGVPVVVGPTFVAIGPTTVVNGGRPAVTQVTVGGQTFTVNPSQVIGPGVVIPLPTNPGIFRPVATPTTVNGVPVLLAPSSAVIAGTTFAIGAGAPSTTIVVNGQTISVGSGGLGFSDTTILPPSLPTNVVVLDGEIITAIGASQVVIDGSTILYGPGSTPQTRLFNGQLITIGPGGVVFGTSTIGGAAGIALGLVGGVTVTEIGYSLAVIDGITYTIGPNAQPITTMINGKPVTIGPSGLIVDDSTLTYPLNHLPATQVITAGGITYSQIGSTLVNIGGTIYTIGPDAKTTTQVYNGQTISLGPGGVGFKTTTVAVLSAPTATQTGKKNGAGAVRPLYGVLGICIAFGVGYLI